MSEPAVSVFRRRPVLIAATLGACLLAALWLWSLRAAMVADARAAPGYNPHPIVLRRPPVHPLSAMALLGKQLFYDRTLSASGRQSCASCHDPSDAYGPPNSLSAQYGGADLNRQGMRPPPSLEYLERQPNFSIGPDNAEAENVNLKQLARAAAGSPRSRKQAGVTAVAPAIVPQGGLFWDGRANTLQNQVIGPLMNPAEMANVSVAEVAQKLDRPAYRKVLEQLFGPRIYEDPKLLVAEATFALARYQIEEPSFHPYDSKFDVWLEGDARFSARELRGYRLFNDPNKGNCAGCHIDRPGRDGLPPLFTDHQYEALAVPRNDKLMFNHKPDFYDLGLCGPLRTDMSEQTQYCGMFLTPTLRNIARRKVFFHNGVYHSLEQVLKFYVLRSTRPASIYPSAQSGKVERYDDLPKRYWANVDTQDAPFDRTEGRVPALDAQERQDVIAFLKTLNDGWKPR